MHTIGVIDTGRYYSNSNLERIIMQGHKAISVLVYFPHSS